jgi:tetratricopeptide (TPR) repeat protein
VSHCDLGVALLHQGDLPAAAASLRRAIQIDPNRWGPHYNLGEVLLRQGDVPAAAASLRRATQIDPNRHDSHCALGIALLGQGDLPAAAASLRRAIQIDPKQGAPHCNLGVVLLRQGDLPAAAASLRRAAQVEPKHPAAHCRLGEVLLRQGDFRAALEAFRTGHDLGSGQKGWGYPSAQAVKRCERFIELEGRLPALLKGEGRPAGAAGRVELALLCRYKGLHAASARFFAEAFAADAKLADDLLAEHRYQAACSAAQAGCGEGADAAAVPDRARASLRKQALAWLRADLAAWARRLEGGTQQVRAEVRVALHGWRGDPALAGVRGAGPLAALPPAERAAWQQLWADVAALAAKAREAK